MKELRNLKTLQRLELGNTSVTDKGLPELKNLVNLQWLDLSLTTLTDAGLIELIDLNNLQVLGLASTRITEQGGRRGVHAGALSTASHDEITAAVIHSVWL